MKFRVRSETGEKAFLLDISDGNLETLQAYADAQNVPLHVALQTILESEIGRLYRDLQAARETFDTMSTRELGFARAAFVGDRDQAVEDGKDVTARFARGRIALIDMVLKQRGER